VDFVIGHQTGPQPLHWFENEGGGNFTQYQVGTTSLMSVCKIDIFDSNGDGHAEIVCTDYKTDTIWWFSNDGSENFSERVVSSSINSPFGVKVGCLMEIMTMM